MDTAFKLTVGRVIDESSISIDVLHTLGYLNRTQFGKYITRVHLIWSPQSLSTQASSSAPTARGLKGERLLPL